MKKLVIYCYYLSKSMYDILLGVVKLKNTEIVFIILIFLLLPNFSFASFWGDGLTVDDIYVKDYESKITDFSSDNYERYLYSINYNLENVSVSFANAKIITYYYDGNNLVTNDDIFNNNTTTIIDDSLLKEFHTVHVSSKLWSDEPLNITHCNIVIMNDNGDLIYNESKSFDMNNYVKDDYLFQENDKIISDKPKSSIESNNHAFFEETDVNDDGKIDFDEFSDVSFIFTEDSFWEEYSIEEILQSEWDSADSNGDGYLTFEEFNIVI